MPPYKLALMQLHSKRQREREWEQTREIMAMIHNMAMGQKAPREGRRLVPLSIDGNLKEQMLAERMTKEEFEELMCKWPDIKN